jgi:hypothetical protein
VIGPRSLTALVHESITLRRGKVKVLGSLVWSSTMSPPAAAHVACPVQAVALRTREPPGCGVPPSTVTTRRHQNGPEDEVRVEGSCRDATLALVLAEPLRLQLVETRSTRGLLAP